MHTDTVVASLQCHHTITGSMVITMTAITNTTIIVVIVIIMIMMIAIILLLLSVSNALPNGESIASLPAVPCLPCERAKPLAHQPAQSRVWAQRA